MLYFHNNIKAFTLVELIVVITIVGILSTIGFVSYSGYLTGARDSNRINQMVKLSDSLQVYSTTKSLPLPDNYIEITASGASNVIAYQGYVGVDVLETIDYTNGGTDPKDYSYYTYYLTKDRKSLQLLTFMEEGNHLTQLNTNNTYAENYEDRYPKVYGKKLGILISAEDSTRNTPAQELTSVTTGLGYLDVVNTTENYRGIISNNNVDNIEGTGAILSQHLSSIQYNNKYSSCDEIYKNISQNRGIDAWYKLSIDGEIISVFCDMSSENYGFIKYFQNEDELIAGYNFDDNINDFSSNLNHSTSTLNTYSTDSIRGKSFDFTSASLGVPDSQSLNFNTNQYTFSVWLKLKVPLSEQDQEYPQIVNKRPWCTDGYIMNFTRTSNNLNTGFCNDDTWGGGNYVGIDNEFENLDYNHYVVEYTGNKFNVYINGDLKRSNSYTAPVTQSSQNLQIGGNIQAYFDNLKLYNRALSKKEISALYQEGL